MYDPQDQYVHETNKNFKPPLDPKWLSSDAENISGSSEDRGGVIPQGYNENMDSNREDFEGDQNMNYQQINREKYFSNEDLNIREDKELLTITVEIGNGEHENIVIMDDDTAEGVAERFCNKYDMNDDLKALFTEQIAQNIEQAREEINLEKYENSDFGEQQYVSTGADGTPQINEPVQNRFQNEATT